MRETTYLVTFGVLLRWAARLQIMVYHHPEGSSHQQLFWSVAEGRERQVATQPGDVISVLSAGEAVVQSKGPRWPLSANTPLHPMGLQSLRNEALEESVGIQVLKGSVLLSHRFSAPVGKRET